MGMGSAKKQGKEPRSPMTTRHSASRALKNQNPGTPQTPSPHPRSGRNRGTPRGGYTHHLPSSNERRNNGRVSGRSLIVWGRPRMAEKLLLHIQYECARHKIGLPWDAIAHRLRPGSSGAAVQQHLGRLRRELITEGHLVPPVPQRPGNNERLDPEIRGFIREDMDGEDVDTTRAIRFDDVVPDRRFPVPSVYNLEQAVDENGNVVKQELSDEAQGYVSPTPNPRAARQQHGSMMNSPRPDPSMNMGQHDNLQFLMTAGGASPNDSIAEEEIMEEEFDSYNSPSVRRQRKQTGFDMPPPVMNPYFMAQTPMALPRQSASVGHIPGAELYGGQMAFGGRPRSYYGDNTSAWAKNAAIMTDPNLNAFQSFGYSLPTGFQYQGYMPPTPNTQQSSQDSSFEAKVSVADTQPSSFTTMNADDANVNVGEFQGNGTQPCDMSSVDDKIDELFKDN